MDDDDEEVDITKSSFVSGVLMPIAAFFTSFRLIIGGMALSDYKFDQMMAQLNGNATQAQYGNVTYAEAHNQFQYIGEVYYGQIALILFGLLEWFWVWRWELDIFNQSKSTGHFTRAIILMVSVGSLAIDPIESDIGLLFLACWFAIVGVFSIVDCVEKFNLEDDDAESWFESRFGKLNPSQQQQIVNILTTELYPSTETQLIMAAHISKILGALIAMNLVTLCLQSALRNDEIQQLLDHLQEIDGNVADIDELIFESNLIYWIRVCIHIAYAVLCLPDLYFFLDNCETCALCTPTTKALLKCGLTSAQVVFVGVHFNSIYHLTWIGLAAFVESTELSRKFCSIVQQRALQKKSAEIGRAREPHQEHEHPQ